MKFLLLLLVVVFAWWLLKTKSRAVPPPDQQAPPQVPQPATAMLACVRCGLHLPQAETVQDAAGRVYCSEAHRQAGPP
jgi:uncharacterized protein